MLSRVVVVVVLGLDIRAGLSDTSCNKQTLYYLFYLLLMKAINVKLCT